MRENAELLDALADRVLRARWRVEACEAEMQAALEDFTKYADALEIVERHFAPAPATPDQPKPETGRIEQ